MAAKRKLKRKKLINVEANAKIVFEEKAGSKEMWRKSMA
jgi:hypothetical protein